MSNLTDVELEVIKEQFAKALKHAVEVLVAAQDKTLRWSNAIDTLRTSLNAAKVRDDIDAAITQFHKNKPDRDC